jgi:hypothetical protein
VAKVVVSAAVLAMSGCAVTQVGLPVGDADVTMPRPEDTNYGAPRVPAPLDATRLLPTPCDVLTPAQREELNLPAGHPDTDEPISKYAGPGCYWTNSDTRNTVGFGFMTTNKKGLSDTYRGRDRFKGYFIPTDVDGYPAVFSDTGDYRQHGTCVLTTGIADTLTFQVSERGTLGVKSCERLKGIAAMVVQTITTGR